MRFKFPKYKSFYVTIGSVSLISSFGYFGQSLISKYNLFGKNEIKSTTFDENKDYIHLNEELNSSYSEDTISESSTTHLQLLGLIQSTNRDNRVSEAAISAIANTILNDFQYREIAQSCDFKTGLRLARTPGVSPKLFLPPLRTHYFTTAANPKPVYDFDKFVLNMLNKAYNCGADHIEDVDCTRLFTELSIEKLEKGSHSHQIEEHIDFNDIQTFKPLSSDESPKMNSLYLQAISQNILCDKTHCKALVDNGLFLVLHYLRNNYSTVELHDWIAQTLANLSVYKDFHSHFWSTNWFGVLVEWLQSDRLEWSLSAAKILYNMNEDSNEYLLPDSIYVLNPIFHDKIDKNVDIVLVHGLLGGTFKTWRQNDTEKDVKGENNCYTRCWPQKWLASDIPDIRLLAVNYQTYISNWSIECQDNKSIFTLKQRSAQLLKDLVSSRVGEKPIIWISHSMGGLIVKQMLVDINESNDPKLKSILNQTKGIVFYSVPHKGTEMAVWTPYLQKIISPSSELLELRKGSKSLHSLHNQFVQIMDDKGIACLSFAETLKSTLKPFYPIKWTRLLVPEESANPDIGHFHRLECNHFNTCKPKHKTSDSYSKVLEFIRKIIEINNTLDDRKGDKISILLSSVFT